MSNKSSQTRKKAKPEAIIQSSKSCGKLTVLTSRSNSNSIMLLTVLSIQHAYIAVLEVDDEQEQGQVGQFPYFYAGPDLRKLPSEVNGMLFNVIHHGATPCLVKNALKMRRRTGAKITVVDSSGKQILTAEENGKMITFNPDLPIRSNKKSINITPHHVMQTALRLNADIVIGLDWPILKLPTAKEREKEFLKKKPFNVQFAIESYEWKNKLIPGALYFQPLQGYTIDHYNIFLDEIKGVHFDGISMPIRNMSVLEVAVFLVILYQRGIRRIHLLGTSRFFVIVLCAYAARNMFEWISLDSSSPQQTAGYHRFYYPSDLTTEALGKNFKVSAGAKNPCQCQYCGGRSFHDIHKIKPNKKNVQLLLQHNYLAIDNVVTDLLAKGGNIADLERDLRGRCRTAYRRREVDKLMRVLSIVDSYKDGDIEVLQARLAKGIKKRK